MKKNLFEELKRIHTLTYGKDKINESFIDDILSSTGLEKLDDPDKADFINDDTKEYFKTLENINEPIVQQPYGSMTYQKNVEAIQIALKLLGYELPRFGVDGLFGKETANAFEKFKRDNVVNNENLSEATLVKLGDMSYSNVKVDNDQTRTDNVNKTLLDDVQSAAKKAGLNVTITTASSGHPSLKSDKPSRHKTNSAVDISIINGISSGNATNKTDGNPEFRNLGNKLVSELVKMGYTLNSEGTNLKSVIWQTNIGGNHFNHVHISNKISPNVNVASNNVKPPVTTTNNTKPTVTTKTIIKPEDVILMINKLKKIGITSNDLKQNVDKVPTEELSEKNVYAKILKLLEAPITEENLKFMYAWRQAEGKGGINNPFNTTWKLPNSTVMNSSGVRNYSSIEDGVNATIKTLSNERYSCIVKGLRNNIGAINISKCPALKIWGSGDLVYKVLLGYERGAKPKIQNLA